MFLQDLKDFCLFFSLNAPIHFQWNLRHNFSVKWGFLGKSPPFLFSFLLEINRFQLVLNFFSTQWILLYIGIMLQIVNLKILKRVELGVYRSAFLYATIISPRASFEFSSVQRGCRMNEFSWPVRYTYCFLQDILKRFRIKLILFYFLRILVWNVGLRFSLVWFGFMAHQPL